ncbi:MAG TPA: ferrochelatase [Frankiaceae bacterium]|nr:ferrochelatase [Frankiaceae bacterium]
MTIGVVVMAYGTPADHDDIERYYTDIRRGRPPAPEQLADLTRRYDAIGGTFPLREITERQVAALQRHLGDGYAVVLGQKHAHPTIEAAVARLADRGVTRVVGVVLAPHYSALSVGEYARRAAEAAQAHGLAATTVEHWHLMPEYLDFLARAVVAAQATLPEDVQRDAEVVFTAHSLPEKAVRTGDPYPDQVRATAEATAALADLFRWSTAWQSAGRTADTWLGPDLLDVIRVRAEEGAAGIVVCACGFVADHLEVAYDLDVEAAALAREVGLPFARTRSVNDDDAVLAALARAVRDAAAAAVAADAGE